MKRIVVILVLSLLLGACERKKDTVIRMETSLGNIRLKLYDETVLHRDNILKLIREGYYNGMLFHRVIKDFMIQTGDPDSKSARPGMVLGANDIGYTLKAEIVPKYFHKSLVKNGGSPVEVTSVANLNQGYWQRPVKPIISIRNGAPADRIFISCREEFLLPISSMKK